MPATALIIAVLVGLLFLSWVLVDPRNPFHIRSKQEMRAVDIVAFRNLMSTEEDAFLRNSLTPAHYRQVRRSRLRAIQEYLVWIAGNCSAIIELLLLGSSNVDGELTVPEAVKTAVELRLACLSCWCLLWAEYLLPHLTVSPLRIINKYEELWRMAQTNMRTQADTAAITLR